MPHVSPEYVRARYKKMKQRSFRLRVILCVSCLLLLLLSKCFPNTPALIYVPCIIAILILLGLCWLNWTCPACGTFLLYPLNFDTWNITATPTRCFLCHTNFLTGLPEDPHDQDKRPGLNMKKVVSIIFFILFVVITAFLVLRSHNAGR